MPSCGCSKNCNNNYPLNPCRNCNTEWSGFYNSQGFIYELNDDGTVNKEAATQTYLISKVGDNMYKVVVNNLTPEQFTLEFLYYKKGTKLYTSSNGGIEMISCEGNQLIADFSGKFEDGKFNGRFVLTPALLDDNNN